MVEHGLTVGLILEIVKLVWWWIVFGRQDAGEGIIAEQLVKLRNKKDKGLHEVHHASP